MSDTTQPSTNARRIGSRAAIHQESRTVMACGWHPVRCGTRPDRMLPFVDDAQNGTRRAMDARLEEVRARVMAGDIQLPARARRADRSALRRRGWSRSHAP